MKLKSGKVNRAAREVEIDGAKFYVRPLSGELYTSFTLYVGDYTDQMLSDKDKRNFIRTHLTDWKDVVFEDDGKEVTPEFSIKLALEVLLDPDADEVITYLYSQALQFRQELDSAKVEDSETAKK